MNLEFDSENRVSSSLIFSAGRFLRSIVAPFLACDNHLSE